ncbi:MAG TPA: CoA transferase [Candidatus Binataceae bacterium]|nr:CoA transferase [Candidatus Binataceae bacterium]
MAEPVKQNLAGLRVLDISQYIAGPTLGRILTDLGADVVKLEMPPAGEYSRKGSFPPPVEGQSPTYIYYNRGKRSLCIDFKRPEGAAIVVELVRHFDVVIENYTPGVLSKYGLSYEAFRKVNPRVIMCSVSGFGQKGPRAQFPGNDMTAQALSGLLHLTGNEDGTPVYPGMYLADGGGGVNGATAVLAALYYRDRTGVGQHIDVSLYECVFHIHDVFLMQHMFTHGDHNPGPTGRHRPGATPCGLFKTRDGWIVLTVLNHYWKRFTRDIGKPELAKDPRFNPYYVRWDNRKELEPIIEEWLQSFGSRDEALKFLVDHHYLAAPVMDLRQTVEMIKQEGRGVLQNVEVPGYGEISLPRVPYLFSETKVEFKPILSLLGQDNRAILGESLGYNQQKLDELYAAGILIDDSEMPQTQSGGKPTP